MLASWVEVRMMRDWMEFRPKEWRCKRTVKSNILILNKICFGF